MRIEVFKIYSQYRGIVLEGTCRVIFPSTYTITMDKPIRGLSKGEFVTYNHTCSIEDIKGRATWELERLYEQYEDIYLHYDVYKKLFNEWNLCEQKVHELKEEAIHNKECSVMETVDLIKFHCGMLDRYASCCFRKLIDEYGVLPISLSPLTLKVSIKSIEEQRNVNKSNQNEGKK